MSSLSQAFASSSSLPVGPAALANGPAVLGALTNYSCFNPALLAPHSESDPHGNQGWLFFRVSNMHFCPGSGRGSWRDSVRHHTHIRSYLAGVRLAFSSDAHVPPALLSDPHILEGATSLFRADGSLCEHRIDGGDGVRGTFSGPEDPRPFWSPEPVPVPWLLVSAWSDDCRRLRMHLVKLPADAAPSQRPHATETTASSLTTTTTAAPSLTTAAAAAAAASGPAAPSAAAPQLPLVVNSWPEGGSPALRHPEAEPLQKNWLPFVTSRGELLIEYAIEPHVVLRVDTRTGRCEPLPSGAAVIGGGGGPFASFPPLARLVASVGRLSGGAAPIWLAAHRLYLGLAHLKEERAAPHHIGTASMVYRHVFYAFRDAFPFAMIAAGAPFVLPEPDPLEPATRMETAKESMAESLRPRPRNATTVQFAAGMALSPDGSEVVVSYSTLDCGAQLTRLALNDVLADLAVVW